MSIPPFSNGPTPVKRTVTKSVATIASGFVADYYTDGTADDVQIQAACTAAAGGEVRIRQGNYSIAAVVVVASNTIIGGEGWGTILKMANGANIDGIFQADAKNNVSFRDMQVDGNKSNNTHYVDSLIRADSGDSIRLENIYAHDSAAQGLYLTLATNSVIRDCVSNDNGSVISAQAIGMGFGLSHHISNTNNHNSIVNCKASGNIEYGFSLYGFSTSLPTILACSIIGCRAESNTNGGISIYGASGNSVIDCISISNTGVGILVAGSTDNKVSLNRCDGNGSHGIRSFNDSGVTDIVGIPADSNVFSDNVVTNNAQYGIYLTDSNYNVVSGNQAISNTLAGIIIESSKHNAISHNGCTRNGQRGILLSSVSNSAISGNECVDNSQSVVNLYDGIYLTNSSQYNSVIGNVSSDTQAVQSLLTSDASSGQPIVQIANATLYSPGQTLFITNGTVSEDQTILSVDNANQITLTANLTHTYTVAAGSSVDSLKTQHGGIVESASGTNDHNTIAANICKGNITSPITVVGANTVLGLNVEA